MPPMTSSIKKGLRSKNIWLLAIAEFLFLGGFFSFSGNLPKALEHAHHISPQIAGRIASFLTWGAPAGHVVFPALSDRVGLRKPSVYVFAVSCATCLFFAWRLAPSAATSVLIFLGGFAMGGIMPILLAFPVELPEIGSEYVGGASGLVVSLGNMGGFLVPLVVMSPLVAVGTLKTYTTGFSVISILLAATALVAMFLTESGTRAKTRV